MEKFTSGQFESDMGLDPLFMAMTLFRHRRFEDCLEVCNQLLTKNPKDQVRTIMSTKEDAACIYDK